MASPALDVIIPVYNALDAVRVCVDSVLRWSDPQICRVILANDASDARTTRQLRAWAGEHDHVELIDGARNIGFVRNANRAMRASDAPHLVLLNSDTAVTPGWIDKILACMRSDESIGVASPIANFAPHLRIEMLPGLDYLQMAVLIEALSPRAYPGVVTPEGFCYVISRACREEIGEFDVVYDMGYGEESDFAMRANYFGYRTVCIDDLYIYHRGRASFTQERRDALYEQNKLIFQDRWGLRYRGEFTEFKERDPLKQLRARLSEFTAAGYVRAFK